MSLALPTAPNTDRGPSRAFKKSKPLDLWLRAKVAAAVDWLSKRATTTTTTTTRYEWVVLLDDDAYVVQSRLRRALAWYDASANVAVGKKFHRPNGDVSTLLGGGPGIALSRRALTEIKTACSKKRFPAISKNVPGGDGWLGQCLQAASSSVEHDDGFLSYGPAHHSVDRARRGATAERNSKRLFGLDARGRLDCGGRPLRGGPRFHVDAQVRTSTAPASTRTRFCGRRPRTT